MFFLNVSVQSTYRGQKKARDAWKWSYRVLVMEPGSSVTIPSALNC